MATDPDHHGDSANESGELYDHEVDTNVLEDGEPQTPLWLPLVGCGLFLVLGILLLAMGGGDEDLDVAPEATEAPAADSATP